MKKIAALLLTIIVVTVSFALAGEHRCDILQYKLDRFYFSAGEEASIFAGSRFVIVCGSDTLFEGGIDASYPGVCYSAVSERNFDADSFDDCAAVIATADIDSGAVINIGLGDIDRLETEIIFPDSFANLVNPIKLTFDPAGDNIAASFETGRLDMFVSYDSSHFTVRDANSRSAPAPFFAALVPNPAKAVTAGGMLATSLYYRFSSFYLPFMFDGDRAEPVYSFFKADGTGLRAYPYDTEKGARLFKNIDSPPSTLTLSIGSRSLRKTADFFADILARDRVRVNIVEHDPDADFFIVFVPLETDSVLTGLKFIHRLLSRTEITDRSFNENLTIIGDYLEAAAKATDTAVCFHYCRLADRSLKNDLGVFPLFRPRLFLTSAKRITDCGFDPVGRPLTSGLHKLLRPNNRTEVTQ